MKKMMTLTGVTAAALLWGTWQINSEQATSPPLATARAASTEPNPANSPGLTKVKDPTERALATADADFEFKHAQTLKSARERGKEARERLEALKNGQPLPEPSSVATPPSGAATPNVSVQPPTGLGINRNVNINVPNFAYSPNLRKFVDGLPGLGPTAANNLGSYLPVAVPDTISYPGSDYYEIALVEYTEKMHSDLPPTKLRGYVQMNVAAPHTNYLGPVIVATKDRPVRVKFTNMLPTGAGGNLFLPVDPTIMGAGMGPKGMNVTAGNAVNYTQNRGTLHLHGGRTPWISDGTPHQWTAPAGELTDYPKGLAAQDVPDMPPSKPGEMTFYWSNGQSARLMFYHDHAYGITRLNVYAGEAAGYLITDPTEQGLITSGALPGIGVPLVIQDKTFINDAVTAAATSANLPPGYTPTPQTGAVDPLWTKYVTSGLVGGNLWLPHEYMPNENPFDPRGYNDFGRWDYGPWMLPPMAVQNTELPSPTAIPEAFMDTVIVNGTAFPYVELPPTAVRFRILNACNDRMLNLQLFKAEPLTVRLVNGGTGYVAPVVTFTGGGATTQGSATATVGASGAITAINVTSPGVGYTSAPTVTITDSGLLAGSGATATAAADPVSGAITAITVTSTGAGYNSALTVTINDPTGTGATATATVGAGGAITAITVTSPGAGYTAPTVTITDASIPGGSGAVAFASAGTEVHMAPALANPAYPTWPSDGRPGGVPDPTTMGPSWYQVGNEGGFLAQVQVVPPQPIDFDYNRRSVTIMDMTSRSLFLLPAVRADVVVDLSSYKDGDTLILYNDSPAPAPLYDTRNDLYTDDPDQTSIGGPPTTAPGFGPNTRTVMQIRIKATAPAQPTWNGLAALQAALPAAFAAGQDKIIVPESAYNPAYGTSYADTYVNQLDQSLNLSGTAQSVAQVRATLPGQNYTTPPAVTFFGGGGSGAAAAATLNGVVGITIVTSGSNYSSAATVSITPAAGATGGGATAAALVSGGVISGITIINPGSNYVVAPTVTITDATGTGATATANITLGSVGDIIVTSGGSGYAKAPYVYLTGGGGVGAQADAILTGAQVMTGKNLTEGFDMDYGRMNVQLGSTPNPLSPLVGLGPVVGLAFYIDPPTEILTPETNVLWRLSHIGVDSHAMHFHLFDLQVVNRVDWTGIIKPPYVSEIGWKDTIETDPFTDLIVALRPTKAAMKLPFGLPRSSRLLDVTMPAGSTANFAPVAPPAGVAAAAQITNVVTDFGWEYVWHCHLLGHEENDMMRPIVFDVPATLPTAPVLTATAGKGIVLTWTDPTPFNYATGLPTSTLGNPMNEIGFKIMRGTAGGRGGGGTMTQIGTALANQTNFTDTTAVSGTSYNYQVVVYNAAGSTLSNTRTITAPTVGFVRVASATPQTRTATVTVAYPGTQTAGNLNVIAIGWNDTTSTVLSVTDNRTNVYKLAIGPTRGASYSQSLYYASPIKGGATTVTVTFSTAVPFPDVRALEYTGFNTLDQTAGATGTTYPANSGTVTTTAASELIFGANYVLGSTTGAGTGFTSRIITTPDSDIAEDRVVNAIGTYSATAPGSGATGWIMQMATFK